MNYQEEAKAEKVKVTTTIRRDLWDYAVNQGLKWNYLLSKAIRLMRENPHQFTPNFSPNFGEIHQETDPQKLKLMRKLEEMSQKYHDLLVVLREKGIKLHNFDPKKHKLGGKK